MIPEEYKESYENIAKLMARFGLTSEDVYELVRSLDTDWTRIVFNPLPKSKWVSVKIQSPPKFVSSC